MFAGQALTSGFHIPHGQAQFFAQNAKIQARGYHLIAPFLFNHLRRKIRLPMLCFLRKPRHQLTPECLTAYTEGNPGCSEFVTECVYFEQMCANASKSSFRPQMGWTPKPACLLGWPHKSPQQALAGK